MAQRRELANVERANAYRLGENLVLVVAGEKPTPCHEVDIEELPIEIFPPEFAVTLTVDPLAFCTDVVTPYQRAEAFHLGSGEVEAVTVRAAGSVMSVPVEVLESAEAERLGGIGPVVGEPVEAVGYSKSWDLAEAMRDAISKLPPRGAGIPDWLSTYTVVEIGAQIGGIAGFNDLTVRVRG